MRERRWSRWVGVFGVAPALIVAGLIAGRGPAMVDWREVRGVVLESDDWGLCGFFPDTTAMAGLSPAALQTGPFPPVYWGSTLEDSAAVAELAAVLAGVRGRDGLPAVLQPNYILSSLSWEPAPGGGDPWVPRDLPDLPPSYARPGLWSAVQAATAAGVWHPELHGRWHYDPAQRRAGVDAGPAAREAAARHVMLFPNSERAWELGPWRPRAELAAELDGSLRIFRRLFGRAPRAVIAPDYRWDDRVESLWLSRGLATIQAKRGQRLARYMTPAGRVRKVVDRTLARLVRRDRVYLERNVPFEPVQHATPGAAVSPAAADVARAWRRGEPAVIETHRINFAHLDGGIAARGRTELGALLAQTVAAKAAPATFLVDGEVADLQRRGTSWCDRGEIRVIRNLTRSRRLVVVPGAGAVSLGPGEVRIASRGADERSLRWSAVPVDQ